MKNTDLLTRQTVQDAFAGQDLYTMKVTDADHFQINSLVPVNVERIINAIPADYDRDQVDEALKQMELRKDDGR